MLYVVGGIHFADQSATGEVFEVNSTNFTWRSLKSLPYPIYDCGAMVTADDLLCVIGGKNASGFHAEVLVRWGCHDKINKNSA